MRLGFSQVAQMFRSPLFSRGLIVSDEGFRVRLLSRYFLLYEEEGLSVKLQFEGDTRKDLFYGSIESPSTDMPLSLSPETEKRIYGNVQRALEWKGFSVRLV
jgi:hypothetical protein